MTHYLQPGTRVTYRCTDGRERQGTVAQVFHGQQHPYVVRLGKGQLAVCGLDRLFPPDTATCSAPSCLSCEQRRWLDGSY